MQEALGMIECRASDQLIVVVADPRAGAVVEETSAASGLLIENEVAFGKREPTTCKTLLTASPTSVY